jgi:hypothetical protein
MGKFLGGCLIVCLVLVVGGGAVGYYVFVKPYTDMAGEAVAFAQELETLDSEIATRGPYQPPKDGAVSPDAMQRYLAVQRGMRTDLEGDMQTLQARYEALDNELESEQRDASIAEIMTAYRDLAGLYLEAKRAQVAALNEQRMSINEYHWIRGQIYAALGQPVAVAAPDGSAPAAAVSSVPPETRALVEEHREMLTDNYALVWFGL